MKDLSMKVELACPTCGCTQFAYEEPLAGQDFTDEWGFKCTHCGRTYTRKCLVEANSDYIDATAETMGDEYRQEIAKEIERELGKIKGLKIEVKI